MPPGLSTSDFYYIAPEIVLTLGSMLVLMADIIVPRFWWGGSRRGGARASGGGFAIVALIGIVLALLAPLFAQLIRLSISRRREYLADASF